MRNAGFIEKVRQPGAANALSDEEEVGGHGAKIEERGKKGDGRREKKEERRKKKEERRMGSCFYLLTSFFSLLSIYSTIIFRPSL
jgi:hypothetical protein